MITLLAPLLLLQLHLCAEPATMPVRLKGERISDVLYERYTGSRTLRVFLDFREATVADIVFTETAGDGSEVRVVLGRYRELGIADVTFRIIDVREHGNLYFVWSTNSKAVGVDLLLPRTPGYVHAGAVRLWPPESIGSLPPICPQVISVRDEGQTRVFTVRLTEEHTGSEVAVGDLFVNLRRDEPKEPRARFELRPRPATRPAP